MIVETLNEDFFLVRVGSRIPRGLDNVGGIWLPDENMYIFRMAELHRVYAILYQRRPLDDVIQELIERIINIENKIPFLNK